MLAALAPILSAQVTIANGVVTGMAGPLVCTLQSPAPPAVITQCTGSAPLPAMTVTPVLAATAGLAENASDGTNSVGWILQQKTAGIVSWQMSVNGNGPVSIGTFGAPPNPAPTVTSLSPSTAVAGAASLTMTITGTGFIPASAVTWNGSSRSTNYVNVTTLQTTIAASDMATVGTVQIAVGNPAPGGGTSGSMPFTITSAVPPPTSISLVQHTSRDAGSIASSTLTFPSVQVAGNRNIVVVRAGGTPSSVSVADTNANPYSLVLSKVEGTDHNLYIYSAGAIKGGGNAVMVSKSGGTTLRFAIAEWAGLPTGVDKSASAIGTGTTADSGTIAAAANEAVVAAVTNTNSVPETATTAYIIDDVVGGVNEPLVVAHTITTGAINTSGHFVWSAPATGWACAVASFH